MSQEREGGPVRKNKILGRVIDEYLLKKRGLSSKRRDRKKRAKP